MVDMGTADGGVMLMVGLSDYYWGWDPKCVEDVEIAYAAVLAIAAVDAYGHGVGYFCFVQLWMRGLKLFLWSSDIDI